MCRRGREIRVGWEAAEEITMGPWGMCGQEHSRDNPLEKNGAHCTSFPKYVALGMLRNPQWDPKGGIFVSIGWPQLYSTWLQQMGDKIQVSSRGNKCPGHKQGGQVEGLAMQKATEISGGW